MSAIWTLAFWRATAERALGTFIASVLGVVTVLDPLQVVDLDWPKTLLAAIVITAITVLKCLATALTTPSSTPSMLQAEVPIDKAEGKPLA